MARFVRPIEKLPARIAAVIAAAVIVAGIASPGEWLDSAIRATGAAAIVPAVAPPIGMTVRVMLVLGSGGLSALLVWAALYATLDAAGFFLPALEDTPPAIRRADAHPDAPPRRPLSVAELRAEPIAPTVEQALPLDLDLPLSAFDPAAIPSVPRTPVRAVAPLAPGERLRTFALTPPSPPQPAAEPTSIDALLQRLGQGRPLGAG